MCFNVFLHTVPDAFDAVAQIISDFHQPALLMPFL